LEYWGFRWGLDYGCIFLIRNVRRIMENGKLLSINFLWTGWAYGMVSENLTLTLGIIGGITLIWLNIEGIITHRKNRK